MRAVAGRRRRRPAGAERPGVYLGDSPWLRTDLVRVGAWLAVGIVIAVIAWYGASGSATWSTQTGWIVLGILAAAVAAVGCAGWLVAGLRTVSAAQAVVLRELNRSRLPVAIAMPAAGPAEFVSGPRMTRFHRTACRLVAGKELSPVGRREIAARELHACGVCEP